VEGEKDTKRTSGGGGGGKGIVFREGRKVGKTIGVGIRAMEEGIQQKSSIVRRESWVGLFTTEKGKHEKKKMEKVSDEVKGA